MSCSNLDVQLEREKRMFPFMNFLNDNVQRIKIAEREDLEEEVILVLKKPATLWKNSPSRCLVLLCSYLCIRVSVSKAEVNLCCHSSGETPLVFFQAGSFPGLELAK